LVSSSDSALLDPSHLSRIKDLSLLARVVVDGAIFGVHRSVRQGRGAEFFQYRPYEPGEDLKSIDWKIYAKRDELVSKTYQEDTNFSVCIILDSSASMGYQGEQAGCSKFKYAQMLPACFAYLAFRQGDKVGLVGGSKQNPVFLPVSSGRGHFHRLLAAIGRMQAGGSDLSTTAWEKIQASIPKRCLVVYLSDFLENEDLLPARLGFARSSSYECLCVQVLDGEESTLPQAEALRFVEMEGSAEISTSPKLISEEVQKKIADYQQKVSRLCRENSVDFESVLSSDDLGYVPHQFIGLRGRKR